MTKALDAVRWRQIQEPDANHAVVTCTDDAPSVRGEAQGAKRSRATRECPHDPACTEVPYFHLAVVAGGCEQAIRSEGDGADAGLMRLECAYRAR